MLQVYKVWAYLLLNMQDLAVVWDPFDLMGCHCSQKGCFARAVAANKAVPPPKCHGDGCILQ